MKALKNGILLLLVVLTTTCLTTSCSKENVTDQKVSENMKVSSYLKSFYPGSYKLGKSVESKVREASNAGSRTTEGEDLVVTEVFVDESSIARGYVITDKITNDFKYFIDVDRENYKLTAAKIVINETKVFENINTLDNYISTNEFDFIKIAADHDNTTGSSNEKFWGTSCGGCWSLHDGSSFRTCRYYIFWQPGNAFQEPC
jgi:hypothetical protein